MIAHHSFPLRCRPLSEFCVQKQMSLWRIAFERLASVLTAVEEGGIVRSSPAATAGASSEAARPRRARRWAPAAGDTRHEGTHDMAQRGEKSLIADEAMRTARRRGHALRRARRAPAPRRARRDGRRGHGHRAPAPRARRVGPRADAALDRHGRPHPRTTSFFSAKANRSTSLRAAASPRRWTTAPAIAGRALSATCVSARR